MTDEKRSQTNPWSAGPKKDGSGMEGSSAASGTTAAEARVRESKGSTATASREGTGAASATLVGKGLDLGTANIVAAMRDGEGLRITRERNAFLDVQGDVFSKSMLTKLGVAYVVHEGKFIVLGEPAFELANIFGRETRRPMSGGLISPSEVDAAPMMRLLISKALGQPTVPEEPVYFSVPAESIDRDNNVMYHKGLFEGMLRKMGYRPTAIGEGHAVVFSELAERDFTGVGLSFGGGMVNVCVSYKTIPALAFSIARAGDWVDKNAAEVLGIPRSRATYLKERGMDVRTPRGRDEEAIAIYYRNLIAYVLENLRARFQNAEGMPSLDEAIDLVCSGGTAMVGGFAEVFREELNRIKLPFPIGEVRLASEPLYTVAKGCLVAAAISE
jgi:hypothetical protein